MDILTNSRMKAARACLRLHYYQYELGYRTAHESDALRLGTLVHRGLEAWWTAVPPHRLDAAFAAMEGEADPYERAKAEEMLRGYDLRWADAPLQVVAVEQQFLGPLVNPRTGAPSKTWRLSGKIDVLVQDRTTGLHLLVEHKTSSEDITPGSDYWKRLRLDGQVSTYYEGGRFLGYQIDGCLYDVLGKPGIKPARATPEDKRKFKADGSLYANQRAEDETSDEYRARIREQIAEDPARFYQRGEVVRLESELAEAQLDTWLTGKIIREAQRAGVAPRNPDACVRYGRTCEFFDVCAGQASLDDPLYFRKVETIHEELIPEASSREER